MTWLARVLGVLDRLYTWNNSNKGFVGSDEGPPVAEYGVYHMNSYGMSANRVSLCQCLHKRLLNSGPGHQNPNRCGRTLEGQEIAAWCSLALQKSSKTTVLAGRVVQDSGCWGWRLVSSRPRRRVQQRSMPRDACILDCTAHCIHSKRLVRTLYIHADIQTYLPACLPTY